MDSDLRSATAVIVKEYVIANPVEARDIVALIQTVYDTLASLGNEPAAESSIEKLVPAVPIKKSVTPDHITCLECGKNGKMLRRHLETHHGLSAEEYRARWNLPANYPFTAPNYSVTRAGLAREIGLGTTHRPKR